MYLQSLQLNNVKCFQEAALTFPHRGDDYSGWIVLLGDNGVGKSTIIQALAVGIIESSKQDERYRRFGWLRTGTNKGDLRLDVVLSESDSYTNRWALCSKVEIPSNVDVADADAQSMLQNSRTTAAAAAPNCFLRQQCRNGLALLRIWSIPQIVVASDPAGIVTNGLPLP